METNGRITKQHLEILEVLFKTGNSDKMIARELGISVRLVSRSVSEMLLVFSAKNRTHLIFVGLQKGLIKLP